LLRCFGALVPLIYLSLLYYFLKAQGQTTKQLLVFIYDAGSQANADALIFQTTTTPFNKAALNNDACARATQMILLLSLGLFNFLSDNECNPIFPIKKKLLSFFSISEILFRTLNEQPSFRVFFCQGL
jgi:hypothetical protein